MAGPKKAKNMLTYWLNGPSEDKHRIGESSLFGSVGNNKQIFRSSYAALMCKGCHEMTQPVYTKTPHVHEWNLQRYKTPANLSGCIGIIWQGLLLWTNSRQRSAKKPNNRNVAVYSDFYLQKNSKEQLLCIRGTLQFCSNVCLI